MSKVCKHTPHIRLQNNNNVDEYQEKRLDEFKKEIKWANLNANFNTVVYDITIMVFSTVFLLTVDTYDMRFSLKCSTVMFAISLLYVLYSYVIGCKAWLFYRDQEYKRLLFSIDENGKFDCETCRDYKIEENKDEKIVTKMNKSSFLIFYSAIICYVIHIILS